MYNDKVIKIFQNPKNVGMIKNADGVGQVGSPACGDVMKIYLKIENNVITDARFKTFGCAAAIATTSVATDMIKNKTLEEALKIRNKDIVDYLGGLPAVKIHCSVLAEEAIAEAIKDYHKKQEKLALKLELEKQKITKN